MENADLASQFVGAIAALAGHASGAGGGEIIAGKQNKNLGYRQMSNMHDSL